MCARDKNVSNFFVGVKSGHYASYLLQINAFFFLYFVHYFSTDFFITFDNTIRF